MRTSASVKEPRGAKVDDVKRVDDLNRKAADIGHPEHPRRVGDKLQRKVALDRIANIKRGDADPRRALAKHKTGNGAL